MLCCSGDRYRAIMALLLFFFSSHFKISKTVQIQSDLLRSGVFGRVGGRGEEGGCECIGVSAFFF